MSFSGGKFFSRMLLFSLLFARIHLYALVDYGSTKTPKISMGNGGGGPASPIPLPAAPSPSALRSESQNFSVSSSGGDEHKKRMVEFSTLYHSLKINGASSGQLHLIENDIKLTPPLDLFFDLNFFAAQSNDFQLIGTKKVQMGNPKMTVGFHWLKMGNPSELMTLDFFSSYMQGIPSSALASSRNDINCGLETSKTIRQFVLALESDYTFTGRPTRQAEMDIGSIWRLGGGIGAVLSSQIRLSLEAYNLKIGKGRVRGNQNILQKEIDYSVFTPKLYLTPSSWWEIIIGLNVQLTAPKTQQNLLQAKLFNYPGLYGNSLFSGVNLIL